MFRQLNIRLILKTAAVLVVGTGVVILLGRLLHRSAAARILPRARQLAEQEQYDEALKLFEIHLARHGDSEDELLEYAHLLARAGHRGSARRLAEVYRKIHELNSNNYDVLKKLTEFTLLAARRRIRFSPDAPNEWAAAQELAESMTKVAPKRPEGHEYLGRALIGLGEFDKARTVLEKLVAEHPAEEDAYFLLAELGERSGGSAEGWRKYIEMAVASNPESWSVQLKAHGFFAVRGEAKPAMRSLSEALALGPGEPAVLFAAGIAEERQGNRDVARQHWRKLLLVDPCGHSADVALARMARAEGNTDAAIVALREGLTRPKALEEDLRRTEQRSASGRKAAELKAGKAELLFQMASICLGLGRPDDAGEYIDQLRAIAPGSPKLALVEGQRSMIEGRADAARTLLERAGRTLELVAKRLPPWSQAHLHVGRLYSQLREHYVLLGRCYLLLGKCYARTGEPGAAKATLAEAVRFWPRWFSARITFAGAALLTNEPDTAAEQAKLAEELVEAEDPKRSIALLTRARALRRLSVGRKSPKKILAHAIEAVKKAVELHATSDALILLAQLHIDAGKHALAEAVLKRAPADPKDALRMRVALVRFYVTTKNHDSAKQVWDNAVKQHGEAIELRLLRPQLLGPDAPFEAKQKCFEEVLAKASSKEAPRLRAALAAFYMDHRKAQKALEQLKAIAAAEPGNAVVRRFLLRLALDTGEVKQAQAIVGELAEIEGASSPRVVCDRAECDLVVAGARRAREVAQEEVAQELEALLKRTPSWRAWVLLGDIRRLQGKVVEAIDHYQAAFRGNPRSIRAGVPLVSALDAAGRDQEAAVVLDRLVTLDSSSPVLLRRQLDRFEREGDLDSAMDAMRLGLERRPDSVRMLLKLGDLLLAKREFGEAEKHLRKAYDLAPQRSEIVDSLVRLLNQTGRQEEALKLCNQFVAARPDSPASYISRSKHHLSRRQPEKAIEDLQHALKLAPKEDGIHRLILLNLGDVATRRGNLDAAVAWYRRAAELEPSGSNARMYLVERLLASGRQSDAAEAAEIAHVLLKQAPDDARANLLKARIVALDPDSADQAKHYCRRAAQLAPGMAQPHSLLSQIHQAEDDLRRATAEASRAVSCEPRSLDALFQYERVLRRQEQYSEARAILEKARRLYPLSTRVMLAQARLTWEERGAEDGPKEAAAELRKAIADLRKAMPPRRGEGAPGEFRLRVNLAWYLDKAGSDREAEVELRTACKLGKNSLDPLAALARFLDARKRFDESDQLLDKAAREGSQARRGGVALLRADLLLARRRGSDDLAEAERLAKKALAARPKSSRAFRILGDVALARRRTKGAVTLYRKSLELDRRNARAANNLAWLLCKSGQHKEALNLARRAVAVDETNPHFQDTLGEVYHKLQRFSEAERPFARCVEISPRSTSAQYKLGRTLWKLKRHEAKGPLERARKLDQESGALSDEQRNEIEKWLNEIKKRLKKKIKHPGKQS